RTRVSADVPLHPLTEDVDRMGDFDGDGELDLAHVDEAYSKPVDQWGTAWLVTYLGDADGITAERVSQFPLEPPWIKGPPHRMGAPDELLRSPSVESTSWAYRSPGQAPLCSGRCRPTPFSRLRWS